MGGQELDRQKSLKLEQTKNPGKKIGRILEYIEPRQGMKVISEFISSFLTA